MTTPSLMRVERLDVPHMNVVLDVRHRQYTDELDALRAQIPVETPWIDLRDYRAPDRDGDATDALQRAMAEPFPKVIMVPPYTYDIYDQAATRTSGTFVVGMGTRASNLRFLPEEDDLSPLYFQGTIGAALFEVGVSMLRISSVTTNTRRKFGIRFDVCSKPRVRYVNIGTSSGTFSGGDPVGPFGGRSSSGIFINGWEYVLIEHATIATDIPLRIGPNTNDANIGFDLSEVRNSQLTCISTSEAPAIYIEPSVLSYRLAFINNNIHPGKYGLYRSDLAAAGVSQSITLDGWWCEQTKATGGYEVYLDSNRKTLGVSIDRAIGGGGAAHNGYYMRNCDNVTMKRIYYVATSGIALDVDSTCNRIVGENFFIQTGNTVSLGGMRLQEGDGWDNGIADLPRDFKLIGTNSAYDAGKVHKYGNMFEIPPMAGSLSNGATLALPTFLGGFSRAVVTITAHGATMHEMFTASYYSGSPGGDLYGGGTTNTGVGNVAGQITVDYVSNSNVLLRNNLGETISYTVEGRLL